MHHVIKVCTKSSNTRLNYWWFLDFCTSYVTLWPWSLTYWSWSCTALRVYVFKLFTKIERNRIIHGWVDDLERFRRAILGGGPNFTILGKDLERSFLHNKFASEFGYFAAFSNAGAQIWVMLKTTPNFSHIDPLWKLLEGWVRCNTNCWSFTYDRTSKIPLMAIPCVNVEGGGLLKRNYKTLQLRMHCNLRPPEPHQPFPALITTLCRVWSRWTYSLPYYSVLRIFALVVTLWLWPLTSWP